MRLVRRRSRRPELVEKLQLEKVIGLTSSNGNGLACNSTTGDLAYLAGCVVVVFSAATSRQTRFFMVSRTPKALACVAYSPHGGKLIAAGECGHQPAVIVWDASDGSCLAELKAHKYGVSCVQFSPNGKHLLSVGFPHDGQICLFDFKSGTLISKVRATTASAPISEIHFASDGSFFVTAGTSPLKHWTMGLHAGRQRPGIGTGTHTLDGRNVNLGSLRESSFVAVASSEDSKDSGGANEIQPIYALTSAGILCLLHRGLAIKKWVNLKVRQAHSLCISGLHIACACSDGIVRIFMIETLAFAATLPRPAPLGFHDLTDANTCAYLATHNVNGIIYPDAVACRFATPVKLAVVYADHSFFIWDVQSFSKVERCQSFLSHSGCIWDAINLPAHMIVGHASTFDSASFRGDSDGQGAFATCSSDGSIRLWCIDSQQDGEDSITNPRDVIVNPCNVYDKNTSGVLYQDKRGGSEVKSILGDHGDSIDLCKGFRSISVSLDGQYLAAGDRSGNLHIYDLHSLQIISLKEAHDAEILTLSFGSVAVMAADNQLVEVPLLASGGRDRLVHIYDASKNFEVIETLDDHSASVTAAKFACNSSKLLSSSADKSVVFRNIESNCLGFKSTRYHQEMASRGTIYDMDIDPYKKMAVTVGQDKKLNFLNLASGKSVKSFKPEGESGEPIKVRIDPSGTCLVCSHSDKSLRIYDISNGDLLSSAQGHAEVITGVVFMPDCKRLISVSGDSCIFVWKLPSSLTKMMRKRCTSRSESQTLHTSMQFLESNGKQDDMSTSTTINKDLASADDTDLAAQKMVPATPHAAGGIPPAFKFSVSRLPHWAQAKVSETIAEQDEDDLEGLSVRSSESRWVERLGPEGYKLFCESQVLMPPATVLPTKFGLRRRFTIEPSGTSAYDTPESSLESQRSGTSASSPKVSGRKDNHWKTVHTLFFDEEEYLEDDASSNRHLLIPLGNDKEHHDLKDSQTAIGEQGDPEIGSKEDSIVVYLSDDEQKFTVPLTTKPSRNRCNDNFDSEKESTEAHFQTPVPLAGMENSRNESTVSVFFRTKQSPIQSSRLELTDETQCLSESLKKKDFFQRRGQGEQFIVPTIDEISDDDDSEQHFSPDSDLFNSHFGNLSTAIKFQAGQASARSSFSARFFAQANHPLPILSLFQDSPGIDITQIMNGRSNPTEVGTTSGSLLATERESLKLQERQDSMAMEVQCMQDHLAHLGIVTAEIGKKLFMGEGTVEFQPIDKPQQLSSTIRERILSPGLGISHVVEPQNDKHIFQPNSESSALNCAILLDESDAQGAIESVGWKDSALHTSQVSLVSQSTSSSISHTVCEVLDAPQSCDKVQGGTYLPFSDRVAIEKENKTLVNDRVELKSSFPGRQQDIVVDDYRQCGTPVMEGYNGACPDVPRDVATGMVLDTLKACDPVDEFKKALQDLSQTVDKALTLYKGLDLVSKTETGVEVANLSSLYEEFIPPTLQKVWLLSDSMTSSHQMREYNASAPDNLPSIECLRSSCSDHCSLRLSSIGINSRPCTAAFFSPTSSALKSIDIEGFIQNYSVRFSETLASQVLALVQKGLSAEHE